MNKEVIETYFYKDEFGNYIISEFEDLGFNLELEDLNLLTKSLNTIGNHIEKLQSQLDIANKKLDKIKELVNKYGYYTLSEIPDISSIIGGE